MWGLAMLVLAVGLVMPVQASAARILVVDDSVTIRRVLVTMLSGLGYDDVVQAGDAKGGLGKLTKNGVDLIIADWTLPDMTGPDMVKRIRAQPRGKTVPILIVATEVASKGVTQFLGEDAGVYASIVKPFPIDTLKAKLELLLSK